MAKKTKDICGPISFGSSPSAALQQSLESKLRARLEGRGSPEYDLTWKHWDTESDAPICALRASGRRTSDKGSIGWPTPAANEFEGGDPAKMFERREREKAKGRNGNGFGLTLGMMASTAGWPTCKATDGTNGGPRENGGDLTAAAKIKAWPTPTRADAANTRNETATRHKIPPTGIHAGETLLDAASKVTGWPSPCTPNGGRSVSTDKMDATGRTVDGKKHTASLEHAVKFAGWPTPKTPTGGPESAQQKKDRGNEKGGAGDLQAVVLTSGPIPTFSLAPTGLRAVLDAAFSRWLMGYPEIWDAASPHISDWRNAQALIAEGG